MQAKTQIKAVLSIFGDNFLPSDITKHSEIPPNKSWVKGDKIKGRNNLFRTESCWEYEVGFVQTLFLDDVINSLIETFEEKIEIVERYVYEKKLEVKLFLIIEIYDEEKPAIYFDKKTMAFLNKLNAEIDIDIYLFKNE